MTPLLQNILDQPKALRDISAHQFGDGLDDLVRTAELLRSKKQIVLSGMGASYFACIPLQYKLAQQGFRVTCIETAELLYFLPKAFDADTAIVLVSRSGESIEIIRLLEETDRSAAAIVGIVNVPGSSLSERADKAIVLNSPADQLVAIQTYTGTLALFELLNAAIGGELDRAQSEMALAATLLQDYLPQWVERRDRLHALLQGAQPLYLLGRGPALGAVAEGVLLMHETAKSSAVGMSVPQFRHGPVEVVNGDFRAVVIGTQTSTAALDLALAKDVIQMGGQVCWLGPNAAGSFPPLFDWPTNIPKRFISIFETIPLQVLAYTKAELCGVRPGDFRWAPAITSSEAGFPGATNG